MSLLTLLDFCRWRHIYKMQIIYLNFQSSHIIFPQIKDTTECTFSHHRVVVMLLDSDAERSCMLSPLVSSRLCLAQIFKRSSCESVCAGSRRMFPRLFVLASGWLVLQPRVGLLGGLEVGREAAGGGGEQREVGTKRLRQICCIWSASSWLRRDIFRDKVQQQFTSIPDCMFSRWGVKYIYTLSGVSFTQWLTST